jgi:hypothetical protein
LLIKDLLKEVTNTYLLQLKKEAIRASTEKDMAFAEGKLVAFDEVMTLVINLFKKYSDPDSNLTDEYKEWLKTA